MIVVGSGDLSEPNSTFGVNSAEYMVKGQQLTHFNVIRGRRRHQDTGPVAEPATAGGNHQARYTGGTPYRPAEPLHRNIRTAAASQWPETLGLAAIGFHSGEVERQAGNVHGVAVHTVTRIAALAQPGEVLISAAAVGLLEGSDLEIEDAGEHELKGLPGPRRVYRLAQASAHARN